MNKNVYPVFAVMCLIFGTTFLAIKVGLDAGWSPLLFAGLRFLFAGMALILFLSVRGRPVPLRAGFIGRASILGILMIAVAFGAMFWGMQYVGSSFVAQIHAVEPVFVALLSIVILRKTVGIFKIAGFVSATAGSFFLIGFTETSDIVTGAVVTLSSLVVLAGELGYAAGSVLYVRLFSSEADPLAVNAISMVVGGLLLCAVSFFEEQSVAFTASGIAALLYLVIVGSLIAHSMFLWIVKQAGAVFASTWLYISPVIASLLGFAILGEPVGIWSLVGTLAIFLGVYLVHRQKRSTEV